jgi:molybdopterin synthase sulfur carrier subunit
MPTIWIPALLRDLTAGQERVEANGASVRQVIDNLEERFPGIKERLCEGDQLRPNIALVVNGQVSRQRMRQRLDPQDEVHFLPAISGGEG